MLHGNVFAKLKQKRSVSSSIQAEAVNYGASWISNSSMKNLQNWSESLKISISDIGVETNNGEDEFETLFNVSSFPKLDDEYVVDNLVLRKFGLTSGTFRIDGIDWIGKKQVFQSLGLITLASIFHGKSVKLNLTHSETEVKKLIIELDFEFRLPEISGAFISLQKFEYWPHQAFRERFDEFDNKYSYPQFLLSNENNLCVSPEHWESRDLVRGFGSLEGLVYMAQFFLDASRPSSKYGEYVFETEGLFRRVAPMSHMSRFFIEGCEMFELLYKDWFE